MLGPSSDRIMSMKRSSAIHQGMPSRVPSCKNTLQARCSRLVPHLKRRNDSSCLFSRYQPELDLWRPHTMEQSICEVLFHRYIYCVPFLAFTPWGTNKKTRGTWCKGLKSELPTLTKTTPRLESSTIASTGSSQRLERNPAVAAKDLSIRKLDDGLLPVESFPNFFALPFYHLDRD